MITVGQLMERLSALDPDAPVVLARDREGNGFSPLDHVGHGLYSPESPWAGDYEEGEGWPEMPAGTIAAVCLGPVS